MMFFKKKPQFKKATLIHERGGIMITLYYDDSSSKKYWSESGIVWSKYPEMEKDYSIGSWLEEISDYVKMHGNPYPTAHLLPNVTTESELDKQKEIIAESIIEIASKPNADYIDTYKKVVKLMDEYAATCFSKTN